MHTSNQTVDDAISRAIRQRLGTAPLGTSHAVKEALAEAGFEIVPKPIGKDPADVIRQAEAELQHFEGLGLVYGGFVHADGNIISLGKEAMHQLEDAYVLTPEGESIIRDLVEHTALTQDAVTAAGDALEKDFDAAPSRFVRHVSGRDHAVDPRALAVRDLIEANALIDSAVATLGHEAADLIMQNLLTPCAGAAAA